MKKNKLIAVFLLFLGILLGILAKLDITASFDTFIYESLIGLESSGLTNIFKFITFLGNTEFILTLNIIAVLIYLYTERKNILIIPINSILSVLVNRFIKIIIRRDRPSVKRLIEENFYSYPSGHAMISVLFYGTLILIVSKSRLKCKFFINAFILLIIILIGITRIYLGVHYASDIIGGYLISLSVLLLSKESVYESLNNRS